MLVVKKNLRVSERFPYPVRVEAVLELIDQLPVRKLEKMTRKGSSIRFCNTAVSLTARRRGLQVHLIKMIRSRIRVNSSLILQSLLAYL